MIQAAFPIWHLWMSLCFQATAGADNRPQPVSGESDIRPGKWGWCGSRYNLEPANATGAIECAFKIPFGQGRTISISARDKPRLLCDDYGAKIWLAPFTNDPTAPDAPSQDNLTFNTAELASFTLRGALGCCNYKVSATCSGWGMLGDGPGREALVSINHSDKPEPVSCNDADLC
ncbi:hypothetical protein F5B17DRAFT_441992 [Nemania serpens]|nr:hypothetical protein F5B17DRAFT_441992 [Nemania serpens]